MDWEWWQLFLGLAIVFFVMVYLSGSYQKNEKERRFFEQQHYERSLKARLIMKQENGDGEWTHPNSDEKVKLTQEEKRELQQGISSLERPFKEEEDLDKAFLLKVPEILNRRINQRFTKHDVKDKLEISETQLKRAKVQNEMADEAIEWSTKDQEFELNQLRHKEKVMRRKKLLDKRMEDRELDYDLSIAEKKAKLSAIENPPKPEKTQAPRSLSEEISEMERKIEDEQNLMEARLFKIIGKNDFEDLPEDQQERYLMVENHHQEILQKMYRKLNDLRSRQI